MSTTRPVPSRTMLRWLAVAACAVATALTAAPRPPATGAAAGEPIAVLVEADWIDQDARFTPDVSAGIENRKSKIENVTTAEDASGGCDGIKNGRWGFHTASGETDPWWQVDLGAVDALDRVVVFNRTDGAAPARTRNLRILVAEGQGKEFTLAYQHDGTLFYGVKASKPLVVTLREKGIRARLVRLQVLGRCSFALDEVEVYAADNPGKNIALGKPADQKSVGAYSYPGTLPENLDRAPAVIPRGAAFSLAHTRDEVERAKRLAGRLRATVAGARLRPLETALRELEGRLSVVERGGEPTPEARRSLYLEARRIKRAIAFCNPLLDFDRLLLTKRHDPGGPFHMCDQYYGCNAKPGGGLFVLDDPFGPAPKVSNLLENAAVASGRLKGQRLVPGAFLSPELSFDGKTILFAYTQGKATATYQWGPEISYHLFGCRADGSSLAQLTDGEADDFDPCFLPGGRVAFISGRRGGFVRCGRHCPVYTLFSMRPDGSDVTCLSFHETHEWHPSVTNDGMLLYTRWDYVDRDTNVAHHLWQCFPDGRDPRSFHGNYPARRESRPWMEMSARAIPGSHRFVAVTGAHHGHAFGSLVLVDHRRPDDGSLSQVERLTPEVPFPEAEGRPTQGYMVYGTPWPLSEDDYLCAYDAAARNRGIYWLDRFGNKELIYRDPAISCCDPIPLRPRPRPPVIPDATAPSGGRPATVALLNVYDSDFVWPSDGKVRALRVVQVLPKSTPPPNEPRIGVAEQTNARAVLGTVPVEDDGSACFEAPVGKPIYFQALDERGLALQSMRSATYLHAGERLVCQGCHERKLAGPKNAGAAPLALRRPPSRITPEADGSNPFNYPRLVQPVLDRHCAGCHGGRQAPDLRGVAERGFTRSYNALAGRYGFYFHVTNGSINTGVHGGSRTPAGRFGARASGLFGLLEQGHHGVSLPTEEMRRLTLWLDCNSEFYGAYENTAAQARGEVVRPSLE